MSQRDIRSLFGKKAGGGDDEKTESARVLKQNEKRKTQQKEYDKKRRKRDVKEAWLEEFIQELVKAHLIICLFNSCFLSYLDINKTKIVLI